MGEAVMVMRTVPGHSGARTGEDVEDLRHWLRTALTGGPDIHEVVVLSCPRHGRERPTWAYVEADPRAGVARRRCLACAASTALLDSEQRWTHPHMHQCAGCGHSLTELAVGLSVPDGEHVTWLALGARCVECGRLAGLTDLVLDAVPVAEVLGAL